MWCEFAQAIPGRMRYNGVAIVRRRVTVERNPSTSSGQAALRKAQGLTASGWYGDRRNIVEIWDDYLLLHAAG